jgi:hypothetical protein
MSKMDAGFQQSFHFRFCCHHGLSLLSAYDPDLSGLPFLGNVVSVSVSACADVDFSPANQSSFGPDDGESKIILI